MRIISRRYAFILFLLLCLQSCFPDMGNQNFTSFPLYLYNNSSQNGCVADSVDVTFVIKNVSNAVSEEVRISVSAREQKYAQIEGTRDEFINVRLLKSADSSLILEQRIAIGKLFYEGGDQATRKISYCGNDAFLLSGFAK
jgi:hypothetical protein